MSGVAPLLNDYKYSLLFTRLIQSITGGIKIERKLSRYTHLIQWSLWTLPFLLSLPFLGISFVWNNNYYLGIIYGVILALVFLSLNIIVKLVIVKYDNESENDDIPTFTQVLKYVFNHERKIPFLLLHSFISALTGYAVFIMTDIPILLTILPVWFIVVAYPIVWLVSTPSLYSLLVRVPDIEMTSGYRSILPHQDELQLRFIWRSMYVIIFGITFIVLRNLTSISSVYYYVLYSCFSIFPFLYTFGVLPSLDSLVFWLLEQSLVHLLGGTQGASEMRLVFLFFIGLISTIIVSVLASYSTINTWSLIATILGFLTSLNTIQLLLHTTELLLSKCLSRCYTKISKFFDSLYYSSYFCLQSKHINTFKSLSLDSLVGFIRNTLLLTMSIIIIYFTVRTTELSITVERLSHGLIISLGLFEMMTSKCVQLYWFGAIRSVLHPRNKESVDRFKKRRLLLYYFISVPRQFLFLYIYPLCMLAYIGINLHHTTSVNIPVIWLAITTLRLLRKVWQNTSSVLNELFIIAILHLILPDDNYWIMKLDIGTQCLIIGYTIHTISNLYSNIWFYCILLYGFLTDAKLRTRHCKLTLFLVLLLSPISISSIVISSLLSSPLLPLFTLPILLTVGPRPSFYWPRLIHKSYHTTSTDSVYYRQAEKGIIKALNTTLCGVAVQPGHSLLVRYQDRTILVLIQEIGYSYCTVSMQGLELQETSCHSVEVTRMDDIIDNAYSTNRKSLSYWCNTYPCHVFQTCDAFVANVYSDARNNLSGIIDQSDNLTRFSTNLYKALLYIILRYASIHTNDVPNTELRTASDRSYFSDNTIGQIDSNTSLNSYNDINTLHRLVFPSPSPMRTSDIQLQCLSPTSLRTYNNNRITPINNDNNNTWFPSQSLPMTSRSIATSYNNFPQSWYNYLLAHLLTNSNLAERLTETQLSNIRTLTAVCFGIIDIPTSSRLPTRPTHVFNGFQGQFIVPLSGQNDFKWLQDNSQLFSLVLKAQRYTVKLLYDETALGEVTSEEELLDYFNEYDNNWFIGREDSIDWEQAIIDEKLHLFSIDYKQQNNTYTAHILSLQDEVISFGVINSCALKGVWSNLSWELQYLTNDDDERYSVQAHGRLLRNIMTQTGAIPLGYHIYQSPLTVLSNV